jgi:hypothetical protein
MHLPMSSTATITKAKIKQSQNELALEINWQRRRVTDAYLGAKENTHQISRKAQGIQDLQMHCSAAPSCRLLIFLRPRDVPKSPSDGLRG